MTSDARTELALPPLIATYFEADTSDADTVARCFHEDAVVVDEHRTHRGRAAIARWKAEATAKYH
jgi:ketosteroid isomerase-like protein